jgi:hypothetical protein
MTSIAEAKFRILEIAHQRKVVGLPADGDGAGPPHPANETEEMWLVRRRAAQCVIEALVSRRSVQVKLPRALCTRATSAATSQGGRLDLPSREAAALLPSPRAKPNWARGSGSLKGAERARTHR